MKKKLIILALMSLGVAASAFADYAGGDQNVLPCTDALVYKGEGNLQYKEYGGCSSPWDEYAICFFGYEAIGSVSVKHGGGGGVFCVGGYDPQTYIYGGSSASSMTQYVHTQYGWKDHGEHTDVFSSIPADVRYIKVRFQRTGSAACGSSHMYNIKADRVDAFSFYDTIDNKLADPGTININTNSQVQYKIKLYGVNVLPSTDDVVLEVVGVTGNNPTDYIKIDNCLFNDFSSKSLYGKTYYNLNSTETTVTVRFPKSDKYTVYFNVKHKDLIIQRRTVTFQVSDK